MKVMKRCILLLLCSSLFLSGCNAQRNQTGMQMTDLFFDTVVSIKIWGSQDASILEGVEELCSYYENLLSRTIETSDISRINHANGAPVQVSKETLEILEIALKYCALSDGIFDITIEPLSSLWNFGHNDGQIPSEDAIEEAKSHVDYKTIQIKGDSVLLLDPEAGIDLGAIAKGFIADKIKEYLCEQGIEHAMISLGGNTLAVGNRIDDTPFHLGIQKPFAKQNEIITSIDVSDLSVVSSGIYERYFEKDGVLYHHLLNPQTGYPYENNLYQVTIISEDSVDGDALSTVCFGLGLEKGIEFIQKLDNVDAIFVTEDYEIYDTREMK
ncbi:MAG: FAD:protein FMN transferase [Candidatus Ruminococcus intestinipullorum]|nr:FAD:protein FMN transferase [Candidatus Ruminococcus intestinipullorum]